MLEEHIRQIELDQILQEELPAFVKPVEEKLAPGIVVNSPADLSAYEWLDSKTKLYCSEVVHFVSEWRCFILYGQIIGIRFYYGNRRIEYDPAVIKEAVRAYTSMPAGCALDFGVTDDGHTLLIEMNDGYSLGSYGLEPTLYVKLLTARWAELNGTEDIFSKKSNPKGCN